MATEKQGQSTGEQSAILGASGSENGREGRRRKKMIPFQKIPEASKTTGLSQYYLRNGCKDGSVPHIKSGTVYLVNVPALLRKLGVESDE